MRFFIIFLLFFSPLCAKMIFLDDTFKSQSTVGYGSYVLSQSKDINTIRQANFQPLEKSNFGYKGSEIIWTKVDIYNTSSNPKRLAAINPRAGMDYVSIFVFKNEQLLEAYHMGDQESFVNRPFKSRQSGIAFNIAAGEILTLYTMNANKGPVVAETVIFEIGRYLFAETFLAIVTTLLMAMILGIIIYTLVLLKHINKYAFVFFLLHMFVMLFYYANFNGYILFLSEGKLAFLSEFIAYKGIALGILCIAFFDLYFFDIKKFIPLAYKIALVSLFLHLLFMVSIAFPDSAFVQAISPYNSYLTNAMYLLVIIFVVYITYKKVPYAQYYLVARLSYATGLFIYGQMIFGKLPQNFLTLNASIVGTAIEGFIVAFILSALVQKKLEDAQQINKLLMEHSRFLSVGKKLAAIVHQWKAPLYRMSTIVIYLESLLQKPKISPVDLRDSITHMQNAISLMDQTVTSFYDFYKKEQKPQLFNVNEKILKIMDILQPQLHESNIKVINHLNPKLDLCLKSDIFGHVILIILQNSIDALEKIESTKKEIFLSNSLAKGYISIFIEDTGGGIDSKEIVHFPSYRSNTQNGLGIGLQLVYFLVTKEFSGEVKISNASSGTLCEIKIPL